MLRLIYSSMDATEQGVTPHDVGTMVNPPATVYDSIDYRQLTPPGNRPWVAVNMVTTLDGRVTLGGGHVEKIGTQVDRDVMFRLRLHFDAVLRGAETVRQGPWYPRVPEDLARKRSAMGQEPQPLAVVITGSCDLPLNRQFFTYEGAPGPVVVITTESAPVENVEAARKTCVVRHVGDKRVDIDKALQILANEFGVTRLLSEGGPRLNWDFIKEGAVDELFQTMAPKISGFSGDKALVRGPELLEPVPELKPVTIYEHEGELFSRYAFT